MTTPTATGLVVRRWTRWPMCCQRCCQKDWVIDLDVARFFDSVPWDLKVKTVAARSAGVAVHGLVAGRELLPSRPTAALLTSPICTGMSWCSPE